MICRLQRLHRKILYDLDKNRQWKVTCQRLNMAARGLETCPVNTKPAHKISQQTRSEKKIVCYNTSGLSVCVSIVSGLVLCVPTPKGLELNIKVKYWKIWIYAIKYNAWYFYAFIQCKIANTKLMQHQLKTKLNIGRTKYWLG